MGKVHLLDLPEPTRRVGILRDIWRRALYLFNIDFMDHLIEVGEKSIPVPRLRPSDPEFTKREYFLSLKAAYAEPVTYLAEFKEIAELGSKDPNLPLIASAESLFNFTNEIGAGILAQGQAIEKKLRSDIPAKNFENGVDLSSGEFANFQVLAIFIVERQLGLNNAVGMNVTGGPKGVEETFAALQLTYGGIVVWSGPAELVLARRKAIDDQILDLSKTDELKKALPEIKRRAWELSTAVERVATRMEEVERLAEVDAQRVQHANKPGFWYNGAQGQLRGPGGAARFNLGNTRTVLEVLIVRRELSMEEAKGLVMPRAGKGDLDRTVWSTIQHLNGTFAENKLELKIEKNAEGIYKLSKAVALEP